jgi:hypothetical protein
LRYLQANPLQAFDLLSEDLHGQQTSRPEIYAEGASLPTLGSTEQPGQFPVKRPHTSGPVIG